MPSAEIPITPAVVAALTEGARGGRSLALSALAAGVSDRTVYRWLNRGRADLEAGTGETPHARLCRDLARARLDCAGPLIDAARDAALADIGDDEARPRDVRAILSVLKTLLPRHHGKGAAAEQAAAEAAALAGDASGASGGVPLELARCPACGEDQLPGKAWCGDCQKPMRPGPAGEPTPSLEDSGA